MHDHDDEPPPERPAGFVPVGGPLPPGEAGFLEFELAQRGIESFTSPVAGGDGADTGLQQVEVAPTDLDAARAARDHALADSAPDPHSTPARRRKRNAALAAILGFVAVMRVGRVLHAAAVASVAAILVSAALYLGLSRVGAGAGGGAATGTEDEPEPPRHSRSG